VPNLSQNLHLDQFVDFIDVSNIRQPKVPLAEKPIAYKATSLLTKRAANLWLDRSSLTIPCFALLNAAEFVFAATP
jgi:hypothetical protein